jgi:probable HAF family extracellular repeat protein
MRRSWPVLKTFAAVLLFVAAVHAGPPYHFTSIDYPGAVLTNAQGISPGGDIVGAYTDTSGKQHGFLLSNGNFTSIDFPGAVATTARGINPGGEIVGSYSTAVGSPPPSIHGFLLNQGTYSTVQFPAGPSGVPHGTIAQRIMPNGDILGCLHDTDLMSTMYGFMRTAAGYTGLSLRASMNNGATPDGNHVVGLYTDMMTGFNHGYTIDFGTLTPFDVPGSNFTNAWDINPQGEIVGVFRDTALKLHGFVRSQSGDFSTIDFPGATATRAFGLNPGSDVVGTYVDSAGKTHGFLLSRGQ